MRDFRIDPTTERTPQHFTLLPQHNGTVTTFLYTRTYNSLNLEKVKQKVHSQPDFSPLLRPEAPYQQEFLGVPSAKTSNL